MTHFVVVYDRATGRLVIDSFEGDSAPADALEARLTAELDAGPHDEITTLVAASEADLRVTHARYFQNADELVDDLERAVAS